MNQKDKRLHIAYSTSASYFLQTQVAAMSAIALASRREDLVIHFFDCGISDADWMLFVQRVRRKLGSGFGLIRHVIDMREYDQLGDWHGSKASYVRLATAELIPDADWAVFADGDTIFMSDPLELLEFCGDTGPALLGHDDCPGEDQPRWWSDHGYDWAGQLHVCAGFMLMDLVWMRVHKIKEVCLSMLKSDPNIPTIDQTVLNIVCREKLALLPDGWGCFNFGAGAVRDVKVIHFVTRKPWSVNIKARISIPPLSSMWFKAFELFCDLKPWKICGVSPAVFVLKQFQSKFWLLVFRALNCMQPIRGRYDQMLAVCWNDFRLEKVVSMFERSVK